MSACVYDFLAFEVLYSNMNAWVELYMWAATHRYQLCLVMFRVGEKVSTMLQRVFVI